LKTVPGPSQPLRVENIFHRITKWFDGLSWGEQLVVYLLAGHCFYARCIISAQKDIIDNMNVQHAAVVALGELRDPCAVDALLQTMHGGSEQYVCSETSGAQNSGCYVAY
jgi:PBS lyase HEAT-like repeat